MNKQIYNFTSSFFIHDCLNSFKVHIINERLALSYLQLIIHILSTQGIEDCLESACVTMPKGHDTQKTNKT